MSDRFRHRDRSFGVLLEEIESDLVDSSISLSTILRKAIVLAYHLNNAKLKVWVQREQGGYGDLSKDDLPDYRIIATQSFGKFFGPYGLGFDNARISTFNLPDFLKEIATHVYLFEGIREIESLIELCGERGSLKMLWTTDQLALLQRYPIYDSLVCAQAWRLLTKAQLEQLLDTVRNRLLNFTLELESVIVSSSDGDEIVPEQKVTQIFYQCIIAESQIHQGGTMSTFDQRGQQVDYQFNAAGDINFNNVASGTQFVTELQKLQGELNKAAEAGLIPEENVIEAKYHLVKATQESESAQPDGNTVVNHLQTVLKIVGGATTGVVALTKFTQAIESAIEVAKGLF